jgi:hypothetical protein
VRAQLLDAERRSGCKVFIKKELRAEKNLKKARKNTCKKGPLARIMNNDKLIVLFFTYVLVSVGQWN